MCQEESFFKKISALTLQCSESSLESVCLRAYVLVYVFVSFSLLKENWSQAQDTLCMYSNSRSEELRGFILPASHGEHFMFYNRSQYSRMYWNSRMCVVYFN